MILEWYSLLSCRSNYCMHDYHVNVLADHTWQQVDILISKNQALQILYLEDIKLHELSWIETQENLIPTKLNNDTVQF